MTKVATTRREFKLVRRVFYSCRHDTRIVIFFMVHNGNICCGVHWKGLSEMLPMSAHNILISFC